MEGAKNHGKLVYTALSSTCTSGVMVSELTHYCVKMGIMGLSCSAPAGVFFFFFKMENETY